MSDSDRSRQGVQNRDRTPSPSTQGEENELELYGVWVKAGPEDVEEESVSSGDFSLSDFDDDLSTGDDFDVGALSLEEESDSPGETDGLEDSITDEEENLLSSLEDENDVALELPEEEELAPMDDELDLTSEDLDLSTEDLDLTTEDLDLAAKELDTAEEDLEIAGDDLELSEEELGNVAGDSELVPEDRNAGDASATALGVSTDEFDLGTDFDDDASPSLDLGADAELTFPAEEMDLSIEEAPGEELPILNADDEKVALDLSDLDNDDTEQLLDNLPELEPEETELSDTLSEGTSAISDFDDISAVEAEMSEPPEEIVLDEEPATTPRHQESGDTGSLSILHNIESELESIRDELRALKSELSSLRGGPVRSTAAAQAPLEELESEEAAGGGFFEEDEDETIALTGDELDNILNTAEFTEEAGEPTEVEDLMSDIAGGTPDEGPGDVESLLSDDDTSLEELSLEEGSLGEEEIQDEEDLLGGTELEESLEEEPAVPDEDLPIEEISLDDSLEAELEEPTAAASPADQKVDFLVGDESEVDALAQMDIESELAEIEELEDETEEEFQLDSSGLDLDLSFEQEGNEQEGDELQGDEPASADLSDAAVPEIEDESPDATESIEMEPMEIEEAEPIGEVEELSLDDLEGGGADEEIGGLEAAGAADGPPLSDELKTEIKSVLKYMDQLLEALPEEKIQEFARSEHFIVYKRLFEELGLEQ